MSVYLINPRRGLVSVCITFVLLLVSCGISSSEEANKNALPFASTISTATANNKNNIGGKTGRNFYISSTTTCTKTNYFPFTFELSDSSKNHETCRQKEPDLENSPSDRLQLITNRTKVILGYFPSPTSFSPIVMDILPLDLSELSKQSLTYCLPNKYLYFLQNLYCFENYHIHVCTQNIISMYTPMYFTATGFTSNVKEGGTGGHVRKHGLSSPTLVQKNTTDLSPSAIPCVQAHPDHLSNDQVMMMVWKQIQHTAHLSALLASTPVSSASNSHSLTLFNPLYQALQSSTVSPTSRPSSRPSACSDEPTSRPSGVPTLATTRSPTTSFRPTLRPSNSTFNATGSGKAGDSLLASTTFISSVTAAGTAGVATVAGASYYFLRTAKQFIQVPMAPSDLAMQI